MSVVHGASSDPHREETHEHRQVPLERRRTEMLVDRMESFHHCLEMIRADSKHGQKTDGGVHRVTPADPVPELEA
jgi:hypothetical protein